jgi:hypothetical protein
MIIGGLILLLGIESHLRKYGQKTPKEPASLDLKKR